MRSSSRGSFRTDLPRLAYQTEALGRSLLQLSRKWTLLLLRDMAFLRLARFTDLLHNNPGLTPRVLSRRLREMQGEALIVRSGEGKRVEYLLTPRGHDAVYILLAFLRYGLKYPTGGTPVATARGREKPKEPASRPRSGRP